uniref:Uncharacterized protein n=1 Tax=Rhizophora mucronata TaxID=61149 RepID=A0A2P2J2I6_RHIMU
MRFTILRDLCKQHLAQPVICGLFLLTKPSTAIEP